jgi:peptidoglycan/xylan/chitin deacetylase (PgdA/CDA1 family)
MHRRFHAELLCVEGRGPFRSRPGSPRPIPDTGSVNASIMTPLNQQTRSSLVAGGIRRLFKRGVLSIARHSGILNVWGGSGWRRNRFAVICYHGVSLADEHEWNPSLYVSAEFLRRRLDLLRRGGYTILGLKEAYARLHAGSLPPRTVVLTFDDGTYDFLSVAWPILCEFDIPATVYWTTYYAQRQFPVFSVASRYVAWKAGRPLPDLLPTVRSANGAEKDAWLREVCGRLGVSYQRIHDSRIFSILRPEEVAELARAGCDFQMHTHRHRMPLDEEAFRTEIALNRAKITEATGQTPRHFCYTSGKFRSRFLPWLEAEGVITATTTRPGLINRDTHPLLLPRLVDHVGLSDAEFEAWTSGVAALLPHRSFWKDPDSGERA